MGDGEKRKHKSLLLLDYVGCSLKFTYVHSLRNSVKGLILSSCISLFASARCTLMIEIPYHLNPSCQLLAFVQTCMPILYADSTGLRAQESDEGGSRVSLVDWMGCQSCGRVCLFVRLGDCIQSEYFLWKSSINRLLMF